MVEESRALVDKNGTMKRIFQLLFLCAALAAGPANAEFLKQGALTWLTEHMAIVKSLNPSGFFVVYSEASTSPQTFDLKTLPTRVEIAQRVHPMEQVVHA